MHYIYVHILEITVCMQKNIIHETNIPGISRIHPAIRLILDWADIGHPQSCSHKDHKVTKLQFEFHWDPGTGIRSRSIHGVMSPKN